MPRDIPVGNGSLLVNFDSEYRMRDVYFPYVGQENHTKGHPFDLGLWVDGKFSDMTGGWVKDLRYRDESLVTNVTLENQEWELALHCSDAVDQELDIYLKRITVVNSSPRPRQVRIFLSHDFYLYGNEIGGTAYFDPRSRSIIHYKVHRYFLMSCWAHDEWGVQHFACGRKEAAGTDEFRPEGLTGELSGAPSAWGSPYSTLGIWLNIPAHGQETAYYWMAAGTKYQEVADLNLLVHRITPEELIERSDRYWAAWSNRHHPREDQLSDEIRNIYSRSLLIVQSQIDKRGAIVAATDSDIVRFGKDTYSYVWGRDGAFVAAALAKAGFTHASMKYFEFCAGIVSGEGYQFQHYSPDGSLASNWHPWLVNGKEVLPIQEDSTALTLWALWIHQECSGDVEFVGPLYHSMIKKMADFLVRYRDSETGLPLPSYDLWEERYAVHAYTVASVVAGLRAAARFANLFRDFSLARNYDTVADDMALAACKYLYHPDLERFARSGTRKGGAYLLDETLDISLLSLATLGLVDANDPRMVRTAAAIDESLRVDTNIGGVARYEGDEYQRPDDSPEGVPGNPWFISTLWLADYRIMEAQNVEDLQTVISYLEWCSGNALPSGVLAEQIHPLTGAPLCVSPLTWSHSAFMMTVLKYLERKEELEAAARPVSPQPL
ncbi:MAG: glycoside hydrolase family 15 [Spirochaetaceae bacterium]|nr:glycoside hydrolase family 15 [Spirochaetaceae bacterium]|tara:strand:- start:337579 stop:339570 length:1992 start_codon:yes stop_codon:yes gene_type:complete